LPESLVFLEGLTPEAKSALGGDMVEIKRFPFRVGRESRMFAPPAPVSDSRRRPDSVPNNDLYLIELGSLLNVSRVHFLIDREHSGYLLVDRGSACGTLVEGELVGGRKRGGSRPLRHNDVIIVGTSESRYVFKFLIREKP
jgi:pSer/pThr/pTyr-binding forkhead associated (FHA) protein